MSAHPQLVRLSTPDHPALSALLLSPARPSAALVLAHGAGAGMEHPFMARLADELRRRGVATLRFQFPFAEGGLKRPDPPAVAQRAVRAAVDEISARLPSVPLFAGGKSFGGRMTSQAQAERALPRVRGLVFFGFPLHPAGKPSVLRADHLALVRVPMLFLQGTRDALAESGRMRDVVAGLGDGATLISFDDADHAFHVRAKSGTDDAAVLRALADTATAWMTAVSARAGAI
jgi:predicted alpha/beta-hydrolase family hydrolase